MCTLSSIHWASLDVWGTGGGDLVRRFCLTMAPRLRSSGELRLDDLLKGG
jgi:hypothetical protein